MTVSGIIDLMVAGDKVSIYSNENKALVYCRPVETLSAREMLAEYWDCEVDFIYATSCSHISISLK